MTFKIQKLDKRHTGETSFKYYIQAPTANSKEYYDIRAWCWETWGPSKELHFWLNDARMSWGQPEKVSCQNEHWCWLTDAYHPRLYFRTDKELVLFKLRWE
jgi:hypothetical protein